MEKKLVEEEMLKTWRERSVDLQGGCPGKGIGWDPGYSSITVSSGTSRDPRQRCLEADGRGSSCLRASISSEKEEVRVFSK